VTDARSAAATLRWHVLVATAAIIATVVIVMRGQDIDNIVATQGPAEYYRMHPAHLWPTSLLWLAIAGQLAQLRRRLPGMGPGFAISAGFAILVACAALGAELGSWTMVRTHAPGDDDPLHIAEAALIAGAAGWLFAVTHAMSRAAARLAATQQLPIARQRRRALRLGNALRLTPWGYVVAGFIAVFVEPLGGLAAVAGCVVWSLGAELVLASMLAASRELPGAAVVPARG